MPTVSKLEAAMESLFISGFLLGEDYIPELKDLESYHYDLTKTEPFKREMAKCVKLHLKSLENVKKKRKSK